MPNHAGIVQIFTKSWKQNVRTAKATRVPPTSMVLSPTRALRTRRRAVLPRVGIGLIVARLWLCADTSLATAMVVRVRWAPSTDPAVVGYKVYTRQVGTRYGVPQRVNPPLQADHTMICDVSVLTAGGTYYFAVSDYTADGTESVLSQELAVGATDPCDIDRCYTPTRCEFGTSPDGTPCSVTDLCFVCQTGTCGAPPPLEPVANELLLVTGSLGGRIRASGTSRAPGPVMPPATGSSVKIAGEGGVPIYRLDVPGSAFKGNRAGTSFQIRRGFQQAFGWMRIRSRAGNLTLHLDAKSPELGVAFGASKLTWVVRFGPDACLETDLACAGSGVILICD